MRIQSHDAQVGRAGREDGPVDVVDLCMRTRRKRIRCRYVHCIRNPGHPTQIFDKIGRVEGQQQALRSNRSVLRRAKHRRHRGAPASPEATGGAHACDRIDHCVPRRFGERERERHGASRQPNQRAHQWIVALLLPIDPRVMNELELQRERCAAGPSSAHLKRELIRVLEQRAGHGRLARLC